MIPRQKPHENLRKESLMDQAKRAKPKSRWGQAGALSCNAHHAWGAKTIYHKHRLATPGCLEGHGASGDGASPQPLYCPPGCRV